MATMEDNHLFIDTNILVFANVLESPMHEAALTAITIAQEQGRKLWISRQVIREYLTVMTRPQAFENLSKSIVLDQIKAFRKHFNIADDTSIVTDHLQILMADFKFGGKQVHDANIVASMLAYNIPSLLTHNVKDFKRFDKIIMLETL